MSSKHNDARRLLVLSYHFPPDGSVGGLRWAGLSKYLVRRGWEVTVITAAKQPDAPRQDGVRVIHVPRARTLNDAYNAWAERRRATSGAERGPAGAPGATTAPRANVSGAAPSVGARLLGNARRLVSEALVFPDFARGWILRAARAARSELRADQYAAIVTSGPPHSTHIAGALASLGRPEPLWIDLRDPWGVSIAKTQTMATFGGSYVPRQDGHQFESRILPRAKGVIANTAGLASLLRQAFPRVAIATIRNGIDPERLPRSSGMKFDEFTISYAGTLYMGRDLTPLIQAMHDFIAQQPAARDALRLRIAGVMNDRLSARLWEAADKAQLRDAIQVLGRVSSQEAMSLVDRSHLTVVLAQDQMVQVPAKLYECVALGVPTLVVAEGLSESAHEARRIGAFTVEPDDVDGMRAILAQLWGQPAPERPPVAAFSYETIAAQVERLLEQDQSDDPADAEGAARAHATSLEDQS